jgi:LmbE family N-acetylglucosaminyl deacetylase
MHLRFLFIFSLIPFLLGAQKPVKPTPADLHQGIKKLNVLGSVLYVAAHPDDENQRFISYCANYKLFEITYLSLTRGDGGQNLIGPELRDLLGVLRTEELLMARSVDGGKQRFSRANDFGYSKNPEETFRIWDKDAVLSDVVWAMRQTQPDVVVNRFHHDKKYVTHGHHTGSAMLAVEAFDLAGKADIYPEQLAYTQPWQPKRQFFNTSWWFFGGRDKFDAMDKSNLFSLDAGVFLPLKGKSNNEISAEARSMHRCQGFGEFTKRGEALEYFDFIKGERPKTNDLFEGINTTWTRVEGGEKIGKLLTKIDKNYRSDHPEAAVPDLIKALKMIEVLPDGYWKKVKLAQIKEVIKGCLGIYLEAVADNSTGTPGAPVEINLEAIQRAGVKIQLTGISVLPGLFDTTMTFDLANNKDFTYRKKVMIPADAPFTAPFWLQMPGTTGMYNVPDQNLHNMPETPRYAKVRWTFNIDGTPMEYTTDVAFKTEESARGEVWKPFDVLPPAVVEFTQASYLFTNRTQKVAVLVKAERDGAEGTVALSVPTGWTVTPDPGENTFSLAKKGEEKLCHFTVVAPDAESNADLRATLHIADRDYSMRLVNIEYEHIPTQHVLLPAHAKASRMSLIVTASKIGYYMGAGDEIPDALRLMGCQVTLLEDKDLEASTLAKFDAVVMGIRAYNTKQALALRNEALFEYVKQGGTLVTQYNNNFDYTTEKLSPVPMKLSRTRVTDEFAEMRFVKPGHPVLNTPNKLTSGDFEGWVQERGLYFASEWDPAFTAPISCNDPEEKPAEGSLLIAPYGKGTFVYTALSFFRELPAGVPGAYRLFANIISL